MLFVDSCNSKICHLFTHCPVFCDVCWLLLLNLIFPVPLAVLYDIYLTAVCLFRYLLIPILQLHYGSQGREFYFYLWIYTFDRSDNILWQIWNLTICNSWLLMPCNVSITWLYIVHTLWCNSVPKMDGMDKCWKCVTMATTLSSCSTHCMKWHSWLQHTASQ